MVTVKSQLKKLLLGGPPKVRIVKDLARSFVTSYSMANFLHTERGLDRDRNMEA